MWCQIHLTSLKVFILGPLGPWVLVPARYTFMLMMPSSNHLALHSTLSHPASNSVSLPSRSLLTAKLPMFDYCDMIFKIASNFTLTGLDSIHHLIIHFSSDVPFSTHHYDLYKAIGLIASWAKGIQMDFCLFFRCFTSYPRGFFSRKVTVKRFQVIYCVLLNVPICGDWW